jgi:Raf kinase inhibitor-like YbhB/YbcL family protein
MATAVRLAVLLLSFAELFCCAFAQDSVRQPMANPLQFVIKAPAFPPGGQIPKTYTCEGENRSPAIEWEGAPPRTASFALIMDDPDAPAGTWTHWVLWNVPANAHRLSEGIPKRDELENGARQGRNSDGNSGYDGPCPPAGRAHRYFFRLYALDQKLDVSAGSGRATLQEAMKGHVLAEAEYMGRYARSGSR